MQISAQETRFGATAGYLNGASKITVFGEETSGTDSGFYGGLVAEIGLSESFAIQTEVLYMNIDDSSLLQVPFFGKGIVVRGSPLAMASNPTVVCEACQVLFGVNIQESEIAHALNLATLYVDGFNTSNPTKANPEDNVLFLKGTAVTYYGRALLAALGMLIDEGSTESSEKLFEPAKAKAIEILEGWTKNGPPTSEDPKEAVYIGTAVTVKVLCELYDRGRCPPVYDGMLPFVVADLFDGKTLEEVICLIHDKYYVKNGADLFKQAIETLRER